MTRKRKIQVVNGALALVTGICAAQNWGGWRRRDINDTSQRSSHIVYTEEWVPVDEDKVRTARETASHSTGTPEWSNAPGFEKDAFAFARIKYKYAKGPQISRTASQWGWITDYPDSDLNLSYRIQQMTSIRVDPDGRTLFLTDPELFDYPWIYMVEVGRMELRDEEVPILRKYLLNGGVLMADDFWGQKQWDNFERQMKRVLPDRHFEELPMDHPLFHCVFDLQVPKNKLQTPNIQQGIRSLDANSGDYGITWEYYHDDYNNYDRQGRAAKDMHVRAMLDSQSRIMIIATHNCDNGDGWEREGEDEYFFHRFSENIAYPLAINIIVYSMTH